jgi:hypothetical protein
LRPVIAYEICRETGSIAGARFESSATKTGEIAIDFSFVIERQCPVKIFINNIYEGR